MTHMQTFEDEQDQRLTRLVKGTVGAGLDAQRGRAAAAFREAIALRGNARPIARSEQGFQWMKLWAGTASAIAACLAVVLTAQFVMRPLAGGGGSSGTPVVSNPTAPVMDQVTFTRDLDGGTVVLDDQTPARMVRQQSVRKTEWFDPREKATYSVTEPIEKVGYVPLQPF
jgi:hypothetical protein